MVDRLKSKCELQEANWNSLEKKFDDKEDQLMENFRELEDKVDKLMKKFKNLDKLQIIIGKLFSISFDLAFD